MERERAEVVWEFLTLSQRIALKNSLSQDFHFKPESRWSELSPGQQQSLLRIDWEFTLGKKFPQLNQK